MSKVGTLLRKIIQVQILLFKTTNHLILLYLWLLETADNLWLIQTPNNLCLLETSDNLWLTETPYNF
jgi:hypothetical protein